ncbi:MULTISPECIES: response regulator transcription factor [Ectothiorhodospira]|uniref:Two-component system, OmpR family, response regulator PhoP n=1 Tax=Ectothiorhodospira marina TaxID=1396821 RepID=A0A1H7J2X3_9GAMM|nr:MULTISPECIES: response regulator transcription factor [Ectothiorhodospira]MCG5515497.1 response regulator transcription factor [Ectothiorhodospira sp. 9100]MCG5518130.1 response regulator transcription factor [Ectothiorhodospira sp. 9905]SEK68237.1 two-component system, OmpR family, response regulator PhoP [Ectothiorhodospira marina]
MRVVVIEDEPSLLAQLRQRLEGEGWMVDTSSDGRDGLYQLMEYPADVAVVDLGLPELPGLEVIRRARAQGRRLPILILTARGQWQEKVQGLEAGADDYLVKPFHMEELVARLKALARRAVGSTDGCLTLGPLVLDTHAQQVSMEGDAVILTTFEYRLLEHLARHSGQVLSKQALTDYLYPHDEDRDSNVLEVLIGRLRRKLDPDGRHTPIETLRGRGYRLTLSPVDRA